MAVTPRDLSHLALKRHQQPWNWTLQFSSLWLFGLALLFHSYLFLASSLILFGTGFFELNMPMKEKNVWFSFVHARIEWEKNWIATPWSFHKWWRFVFILGVTGVLVWALWIREYAILMLMGGGACLLRIVQKNKELGIDP